MALFINTNEGARILPHGEDGNPGKRLDFGVEVDLTEAEVAIPGVAEWIVSGVLVPAEVWVGNAAKTVTDLQAQIAALQAQLDAAPVGKK